MTQISPAASRDAASVLLWLWFMPLLSVSEMTKITGLATYKCYRLLPMLVTADLVCSVRLGMLYPAQDRWLLTSRGIDHVRNTTGLQAPWAVREKNLQWLIWRLPHVEAAYRVMPGLWTHQGMTGPRTVPTNPGPDAGGNHVPGRAAADRFSVAARPEPARACHLLQPVVGPGGRDRIRRHANPVAGEARTGAPGPGITQPRGAAASAGGLGADGQRPPVGDPGFRALDRRRTC